MASRAILLYDFTIMFTRGPSCLNGVYAQGLLLLTWH